MPIATAVRACVGPWPLTMMMMDARQKTIALWLIFLRLHLPATYSEFPEIREFT